ncbi:MAG: hypothetical protein ACLFWL_14090 [Candidatus Brocadiia bacterium]
MKEDTAPERDFGRLCGLCNRYRFVRSARKFFEVLVDHSMPGLVVVACGVFLSKILWTPLIYGLWLLPVWVAFVGIWSFLRKDAWRVSQRRADALADLRSESHGVFMSLHESGEDQWADKVGRSQIALRAGFPVRAFLKATGMAGVIIVLALLPDLRHSPETAGGTTPARVEETSDLVKVLEQTTLAEKDYLKDAEKLLKEMKEKGSRLEQRDWQALDECRRELQRQAATNYRKKEIAEEQAHRVRQRIRAGGKLNPEDARRLASASKSLNADKMGKFMEQASRRTGLSPEELQKLMSQCESGETGLNSEQLEALGELADEALKQAKKRAAKARDAMEACGFSEEELAELAQQGGRPGRSGIDRGPGPAQLQHSGNTDKDFGEFDAKTFKGREGKLDADIGYSYIPPDETDETEARLIEGGSREFRAGNERLTWHSRLLPRHHDTLKEYFAEDNEKNGEK